VRLYQRGHGLEMLVLPLQAEIEDFSLADFERNGRVEERGFGYLGLLDGRRSMEFLCFGFREGFGGFISAPRLANRWCFARLVGAGGFRLCSPGLSRVFREHCDVRAQKLGILKFVVDPGRFFDRGGENAIQEFQCFISMKIL